MQVRLQLEISRSTLKSRMWVSTGASGVDAFGAWSLNSWPLRPGTHVRVDSVTPGRMSVARVVVLRS